MYQYNICCALVNSSVIVQNDTQSFGFLKELHFQTAQRPILQFRHSFLSENLPERVRLPTYTPHISISIIVSLNRNILTVLAVSQFESYFEECNLLSRLYLYVSWISDLGGIFPNLANNQLYSLKQIEAIVYLF